MGGWYKLDRLLELLHRAEDILFEIGQDEASDAVEQAIIMLRDKKTKDRENKEDV